MKADDPYLDVLQNIEFAVAQVWRAHPEMTDYVALRAYEAAFQNYRAEFRGGTPKPHGLSGLDAQTFAAIQQACEFRLGRGAKTKEEIPPVPLEAIVDCLRKLGKSVEFNTKMGGRKGYLTFIDKFLP